MNILHTVEFYDPSIGGAQTVVKQLSERLAAKGNQVTVATSKLNHSRDPVINGVSIQEFAISGNAVKGYHGEVEVYQRFLMNHQFDLIMNYAAQEWTTDLFFDLMPQIKAKKVFVPCGFSRLHHPQYASYFAQMPFWLKQYDVNVFLSSTYQDIKFAQKHGLKNFKVIPNGADEQEFLTKSSTNIRQKLHLPQKTLLILLVGSHTGQKGHLQAIEIFKRAATPNSTLLIIGNPIPGGCSYRCQLQQIIHYLSLTTYSQQRHIIIAKFDRSDTVAAYQQADVFLFPSQVECSPLVLFEAMAAKLPFLTTNVGNAKEIIQWSGGGELLSPNPRQAAQQLKRLALNPIRRRQLGASGHRAWKKRFTWAKIAAQYEALYQSLLD